MNRKKTARRIEVGFFVSTIRRGLMYRFSNQPFARHILFSGDSIIGG